MWLESEFIVPWLEYQRRRHEHNRARSPGKPTHPCQPSRAQNQIKRMDRASASTNDGLLEWHDTPHEIKVDPFRCKNDPANLRQTPNNQGVRHLIECFRLEPSKGKTGGFITVRPLSDQEAAAPAGQDVKMMEWSVIDGWHRICALRQLMMSDDDRDKTWSTSFKVRPVAHP